MNNIFLKLISILSINIIALCSETSSKSKYLPANVMVAIGQNNLEKVQKYLKSGGNINARSFLTHFTLLSTASYFGKFDLVKFLVGSGSDVNLYDKSLRMTPLHRASNQGHWQVVEFLLENGAQIEYQDAEGCTPLICAVKEHRLEVIKILIKKGANILAKNSANNTAFDIAWNGYEELYKKYQMQQDTVWLKIAIDFKIIAKLLFDEFIKLNYEDIRLNHELLNIIRGYNFDIPQNEWVLYEYEIESIKAFVKKNQKNHSLMS